MPTVPNVFTVLLKIFAFSALTLLVGHLLEHLACKNSLMRCWHGYLCIEQGSNMVQLVPLPSCYLLLH